MSENNRSRSIHLHLDRFQIMKQGRMNYLLEDIKIKGTAKVDEFLGSIAVNYGIRETTGREYLDDWTKAGYINIQKDTIKFVKKPEETTQVS